ncbi:hypothetical protein RJI07_02690 [Mycoplasmatota bacterium WC30]
MKKLLLALIFLFVIPIIGCEFSTAPYTGEIKVGYQTIGGDAMDFSAFLAFTVENSSGDTENPINIKFEYGHVYPEEEYETWNSTYSMSVFVSDSTNNHNRDNTEYILLYDIKLNDFISNDYKCQVDLSKISSTIVFNKSFELFVSPEEITYDIGMLYFVMYQGDFTPEQNMTLPRIFQVIYFTNSEGTLILTEDNPF